MKFNKERLTNTLIHLNNSTCFSQPVYAPERSTNTAEIYPPSVQSRGLCHRRTKTMPSLSQQNLLRIVSHHWYNRWSVWNPKPLIVKFAQANNSISQPQSIAMHNVNIEHNTLDKASIFCSNAKAFPLNPPGTSRSDVWLQTKRTSSAFDSIS